MKETVDQTDDDGQQVGGDRSDGYAGQTYLWSTEKTENKDSVQDNIKDQAGNISSCW